MNVRRFSLLALAAILLLIVGDYSGICPPSPPILGGVGWFPLRVGRLGAQRWDAQAQPSMQRGVSYATWWPGNYSHPDADLSLANLASTGANWIALVVTGYQDTITSTAIVTTTATPTDADLIHVITEAHRRELKVMLKPHLDLLRDEDHWRGQIGDEFTTETEWAAWFASYRNLIEHYAALAQTHGADQFCVGTELSATIHRADEWRAVIEGVRAHYSGPITYAANHGGEETRITWWDAVDYIGVDAYYPLTDKNDPTLVELKAAWAPHIATLGNLACAWRKPLLFTEIGYRSQDGTNRHPWAWMAEEPIDLQEQADAVRAAFESVYDKPWFAGMFWWSWSTDPFDGSPCDDGYTPHDKPAEDVLRAWYGAPPRPTPTPTPQPDHGRTLAIYTDELGPQWEDWSWNATRNLAATDQVYSGTRAISATLGAWGALSFWQPTFSASPYHWLEFYVRGSPSGQQLLWAFVNAEDDIELRKRPADDCRYIEGGVIEAGTWKRVSIPLSDLNATGQSLVRVSIQDRSGQASTAFWVDELRLIGATWRVYLPVVPGKGVETTWRVYLPVVLGNGN